MIYSIPRTSGGSRDISRKSDAHMMCEAASPYFGKKRINESGLHQLDSMKRQRLGRIKLSTHYQIQRFVVVVLQNSIPETKLTSGYSWLPSGDA